MNEPLESHTPLWDKIKRLIQKNRLPQAFLFIAYRHDDSTAFTNRLLALLLCQGEMPPCGQCRVCRLQMQGVHPDVHFIRQETPGSAIKIDQVRTLQATLYQTPQLGTRRLVVIDPAEKLNISAANALLKILEEPPPHTLFLLIAEHTGSMPATILSRCQKYVVPTPVFSKDSGYIEFLTTHATDEGSKRSQLASEAMSIIMTLCAICEESESPITVASRWSSYAFEDLLWLLYLITAEVIHYQLMEMSHAPSKNQHLWMLSRLLHPIQLFQQLDQINALMKKLDHNINMNQTLMLENLLICYAPQGIHYDKR
ncbi:MAG: DNA polymerase III subunit delta' [Legionellales bacterium]|nr:DNA polymerase III subunit delta' [Legionellales bacterium]